MFFCSKNYIVSWNNLFCILWILNNLIFFFVVDYKVLYTDIGISLRLTSTILCAVFLILTFLSNKFTYLIRFINIFDKINICFSLPFFFCYMSMQSGFSSYWLMNSLSSILFSFILLDKKNPLLLILISCFCAVITYYYVHGAVIVINSQLDLEKVIGTFISPVLVGYFLIKFYLHKQENTFNLFKTDLKENNKELTEELLRAINSREKFFNNISTLEREQFSKLSQQIDNLSELLLTNISADKIRELQEKISMFQAGAKYLISIIDNIENHQNLNLGLHNIETTIRKYILRYNLTYTKKNISPKITIDSKYNKIEFDIDLLEMLFRILMNRGSDSSEHFQTNITITDKPITYHVQVDNKTQERFLNGILINIRFKYENTIKKDNIIIGYSSSEKLDYLKCDNIIDMHYGKFNFTTSERDILFKIHIPTRLSEIRPKVMNTYCKNDLEDDKLIQLLHFNQKNMLKSLANKLINLGLSKDIVSQITELSKKEL